MEQGEYTISARDNDLALAGTYYVEYTIYEPSLGGCDARFWDSTENEWVLDQGSTYKFSLRVVATDEEAFDFAATGTGYADGTFTNLGLEAGPVEQLDSAACPDGVCGPQSGTELLEICDPNTNTVPPRFATAVPLSVEILDGFSPYER